MAWKSGVGTISLNAWNNIEKIQSCCYVNSCWKLISQHSTPIVVLEVDSWPKEVLAMQRVYTTLSQKPRI